MPLREPYLSMVAAIKDYLPTLLADLGMLREKKKFRCPHCLLPTDHDGHHEDKTPSAILTDDKTCFFCLSCGAVGDAINLTQMYYKVDWVTAVYYLHARYTLRQQIDEPTPNFDLMKYKAQHAHNYRDVAVKRAKIKSVPKLKVSAKRKKYEPKKVIPAQPYTPEQYRDALYDEGERIINAGHGVVLYHLEDGQKKPMFLPNVQEHAAAEPIRDKEVLRNVLDREITTAEHVQTVYIGITLQRLICIDVDTHNSDGILNLSQLEAVIGENLPLKHYESTMSGGRHFFYRLPKDYPVIPKDGLWSKVDGLLDVHGIEILSGTRGVICAPSTGYTLFDGGIMRNWFTIADLPRKWSQLLSQKGANITELMSGKNTITKTSNKEVAI